MTLVPTGFPAWVRNSDHTTYGGDLNKTNWHSQGVTNARTDVGAEAFCRLCEDLAAVSRTVPFCTLTVQCNDAAPFTLGPPTIQATNQMTGTTVTPYIGFAPPDNCPSAVRNGNGDVTVVWQTTFIDMQGRVQPFFYRDAYGVAANTTINIQQAIAGANGSSPAIAVYQLVDLDADGLIEAVRVRVFDAGGTPVVNAKFTLDVW